MCKMSDFMSEMHKFIALSCYNNKRRRHVYES